MLNTVLIQIHIKTAAKLAKLCYLMYTLDIIHTYFNRSCGNIIGFISGINCFAFLKIEMKLFETKLIEMKVIALG